MERAIAVRASLPMYELPELRAATDAWWSGVADALHHVGFAAAPRQLDRGEPPELIWRAPDLLLSQCCGRDLVTHLAGVAAAVAIPCYRADGCGPGTYRSWLVVRRADPRRCLPELAGSTAAVNYRGSHSGWIALGHTLARAGLPERFFGRGVLTGSHRASLTAILAGEADLAAIDCVTLALLERSAPDLTSGVRVLAESEIAPALPYITASRRPVADRDRLFAALARATADPALASARERLLIGGFLPVEGDPYARSTAMADAAAGSLQGMAAALDVSPAAATHSSTAV
jgi:ABC-type phosphate/phosphonate transport system substrate-binding protein